MEDFSRDPWIISCLETLNGPPAHSHLIKPFSYWYYSTVTLFSKIGTIVNSLQNTFYFFRKIILAIKLRKPAKYRVSVGWWLQTLVTKWWQSANFLWQENISFLTQHFKKMRPEPLQSHPSVSSFCWYAAPHLSKFQKEENQSSRRYCTFIYKSLHVNFHFSQRRCSKYTMFLLLFGLSSLLFESLILVLYVKSLNCRTRRKPNNPLYY